MKKVLYIGGIVVALALAGYYGAGQWAYRYFMDRSKNNLRHQLMYEGMAEFQKLAENGKLPGNDPREQWDASFPSVDLKNSKVEYPFDMEVTVTSVKDKRVRFGYTLEKKDSRSEWALVKAMRFEPSGQMINVLNEISE